MRTRLRLKLVIVGGSAHAARRICSPTNRFAHVSGDLDMRPCRTFRRTSRFGSASAIRDDRNAPKRFESPAMRIAAEGDIDARFAERRRRLVPSALRRI